MPNSGAPSLARRQLLKRTGTVVLAPLVGLRRRRGGAGDEPFPHGVASGDPRADAVVLWTRYEGTGPPVTVGWAVADDPELASPIASGTAEAVAERDWTVHVDVGGLPAGTTLWYRFEAEGRRSPVGRTRTLPTGPTDEVRLGVVSCAMYSGGWFIAYGRLAERDVDLVLHLGDYVYEDDGGEAVPGRAHDPDGEVTDLAGYRARYAQYRRDPDLQRLHAAHPMVAVWDDHEIANGAWRGGARGHDEDEGGRWEERRAAAVRAWLEWMPVRPAAEPAAAGGVAPIYRGCEMGDLVEVLALDTRLDGRDRQVGSDHPDPAAAVADPDRALLGPQQRDWLFDRVRSSPARWKVVANQVMLAPLPVEVPDALAPLADRFGLVVDGRVINPDQWDGYRAERDRLLGVLAEEGVGNVVVVTGDIHSSWASHLTAGPTDLAAPALAVELVTPAVSAPPFADIVGVGPLAGAARSAILAGNPHVVYADLEARGYVVLHVRPGSVQGDWWHLDTVAQPDGEERFAAGWLVLDGDPRLRRVDEPSPARPAGAPPPPPAPAPKDEETFPLLLGWAAGGAAAAVAAVAGVIALRRRRG